jgi:hypothetical protein
MDREEYNRLFHKHKLNLVAFKPLNDCDEEVLKLVNAAIEAEREACAKVCDAVQKKNEDDGAWMWEARNCATAIRARGNK